MWLFHYFNLKKYYDVLKSKSRYILFNKNINFNKNETELKIENTTNGFRDTNLVLQLIYESQIKSKTAMSWSSRKKKEGHFLYRLFCPKAIFLRFVFYINIYIVYWIHFQKIDTFTYQKTLLFTLLLLVFKIVESLFTISLSKHKLGLFQ